MARLPDRLVRSDDVGVGHDERKVTRERVAAAAGRGGDSELRRGRHL